MIRASLGTWINYATTIAFQILFANAFGASGEASAYVIAFAIAISANSVFVTTALWVVLPRMLTPAGEISRRAARALGALCVGVAILATFLAVLSVIAPLQMSELLETSPEIARSLLITAAVLMVLLVLAGILSSVAVARGRRFVPAVAPAIPSTTGAMWLIAAGSPTVTTTLLAVSIGAFVQVLLSAYAATVGGIRVVDTRPLKTRSLAIWMMAFLAALNLVGPLQRIVATSMESAGAARFDYASRGLQVVLMLVIGGLIIATLPDWSAVRRARILRTEVTRAMAQAGLLLSVAGAMLLVAVTPVIALFLERGAFTSEDTAAVAMLVRLMIPGLIAEGLVLVLSQALLAARFTRAFLFAGFARVAVVVLLTILLGLPFGAAGVAIAYSGALVIAATVTAIPALRAGMLKGGSSLLGRTAIAAMTVLLLGTFLTLAGDKWAWVSIAALFAATLVAVGAMNLAELVPAGIRDRMRVRREPA